MSRCKASQTRDLPAGWGVQGKRGQIPRNEAYIEVRRRAFGPEGRGIRVTQPFGFAQGREPVERQMGVFRELLL
jgi:hypothetical protein